MTDKEVDQLTECVSNMRLLPNTLKRYVSDCLWHFLKRIGYVIQEERFIQKCFSSKPKEFKSKFVKRKG